MAVLDGRPRRLARHASRTKVIAVETVVGDQDYRGFRFDHPQQRPQQHVVKPVSALHDLLVDLEVLLRGPTPDAAGGIA